MKKANRKIFGAILLSSLLLSGCGGKKTLPKNMDDNAVRIAMLNEKVKDCSIKELSVYSVGISVFEKQESVTKVFPIPHTEYVNRLRSMGVIKFDVDNDAVFSQKLGDFISIVNLKNTENVDVILSLLGKDNTFEEYSFLLNNEVVINDKKIVFVYPKNLNLKVLDSSFILGIKDSDGKFSYLKKPSDIFNETYKKTSKMQELDKVFEEKYLREGR